MTITPLSLFKLLLTFYLTANSISAVHACLPPLDEKPASIAKKAQDSHYVFDGVVTEISDTYIKIKVEQYFKGAGPNEVKIAQDKDQENSCTDQFVLEQRALFFTTGDTGGFLEAVYDGAFGSVREMNADNFKQITAATECMATYEKGILTVPCISHTETQKVYQARLEPSSSTDIFKFSVKYAAPVTKIQHLTHFDTGKLGSVPDHWLMGITGEGVSDWKLAEDGTAPSSPLVLKQSGNGDFPWCVIEDSNLTDGFVSVKFKPISGRIDQAAGLVWRWKDAFNYYIARANALEDNISIYYMQDGQRNTIRYVDLPNDLPVNQDEWQTLRVDFQGDHFIVSFEGKTIIDIKDNHIRGEGAIGLWTKEDSVTSFDDFTYGYSVK